MNKFKSYITDEIKYHMENNIPLGELYRVGSEMYYKTFRDARQLYNEGKANKEDIIDAISSTGWAENENWSSNVKSILKKRVDGKHKDELQKLADSLFSE